MVVIFALLCSRQCSSFSSSHSFTAGAMCAIAPGSPIQLLCALVLCVSYLLLVLYANPYKGELEDTLAFLTSLCLSASLLFGLVLIMDKPNDPVFDVMLLGHVLIAINVFPFFYFLARMGAASTPPPPNLPLDLVRKHKKQESIEQIEFAVFWNKTSGKHWAIRVCCVLERNKAGKH